MSYSNVYQPCDHVTLLFTGDSSDDFNNGNGTTPDGINYYFDIPPKYFSNDRGGMCTIQCIGGGFGTKESHRILALQLMSGSVNGFTINDKVKYKDATNAIRVPESPVIAVSHETSTGTGGDLKGTGEYLLSARPQKLHIKITHLQGEASFVTTPPADLAGVMVLKFTYYDPTESRVDMLNHQNYKLL